MSHGYGLPVRSVTRDQPWGLFQALAVKESGLIRRGIPRRSIAWLAMAGNTPRVFGAFDRFHVFDVRVHYQINDDLVVSFGVDNFTKYAPFPQ